MPVSVGIGLSKNKNSYLAGREAAYQAYQRMKLQSASTQDRNPSVAFVFATVQFKPEKLLKGIEEVLSKDVPVVGSSGAGIITPEAIDVRGVAVMVVSSAKIKFTTACEKNLDKKNLRASGQILARAALNTLGASKREIFIIFIDGLIKNVSSLTSGIKETLGISFPLMGGSSADDLRFTKTYQFFNREGLTNSVVGVLIGGDAIIRIGIRHGWKPLGKPRTVTASFGNIIKTVDDKPAISIYKDYFGEDNQEIKSGKLISLSIRYPLGIYLEGEEEYLLRNAMRAERDGSLICQGDVPQGSSLKLMMGTKETALDAAAQAAKSLKKTVGRYKPLKFALIFDSFSRYRLLGRNAKDEINVIQDVLGKDIPFIGFYTYGEQAPLSALDYKGQSHFHNESIAILGIGEE